MNTFVQAVDSLQRTGIVSSSSRLLNTCILHNEKKGAKIMYKIQMFVKLVPLSHQQLPDIAVMKKLHHLLLPNKVINFYDTLK